MKTTLSIQQTNPRHVTHRHLVRSSALWTVQVVLALLFLFAGCLKLIMPIEMMMAQMTVPLPGLFLRCIGVAEVAGALGLIFPGLVGIQRRLTPLAACGLMVIMLGATVVTLIGGGGASALFPLVIGVLLLAVVYGRRSYFQAV